MTEKYNGWTNYATWALSLEVGGAWAEHEYRFWSQLAKELAEVHLETEVTLDQLAVHMKHHLTESTVWAHASGKPRDVAPEDLEHVNWRELAGYFEEEIEATIAEEEDYDEEEDD